MGDCSLGAILVAQSERGVCAILLGDDPDVLTRDLQDRFPRANLTGGDAAFERLVSTVVGFVEAPGRGLKLPLDIRGTAFQQLVWQALQRIPAGSRRASVRPRRCGGLGGLAGGVRWRSPFPVIESCATMVASRAIAGVLSANGCYLNVSRVWPREA